MNKNIGTYAILCTFNGHIYVGQTKSLKRRWWKHTTLLNRGLHYCIKLQEEWNLFGKDYFIYQPIENCSPEKLLERERFWTMFYQADGENGYGVYQEKFIINKEDKDLSKLNNLAKSHLGNTHKEETIVKIKNNNLSAKSLRKTAYLISPEGNIEYMDGIINFAKKHNLHHSQLQKLLRGESATCHGWKLRDAPIKSENSQRYPKKQCILYKNNILHEINGIHKFCREYKLDRGAINRVLTGKAKSHMGWTLNPIE